MLITRHLQIKYMVDYIEREYGERALNGDKASVEVLKAKIAEVEERLER